MIFETYIAAIQAITTGARLTALAANLLEGNLGGATQVTANELGSAADPLDKAKLLHASGDLQLLIGNRLAAENAYERALPYLAGSELIGAMSCRATGLQMMVRGRLETAASCFMKNMGVEQDDLRFEALVMLALLYREAGLLELSLWFVDRLFSDERLEAQPGWRDIARTLRADVRVYCKLLGSKHVADHVFWHAFDWPASVADEGTPAPDALRTGSGPVCGILAQRQQHLRQLLALSEAGPGDTLLKLRDEMFSRQTLPGRCRQALLFQENALAALAGGHQAIASTFLSALAPHDRMQSGIDAPLAGITLPGQIERIYCSAKLLIEQGALSQGMLLYRNYLKVALRTTRSLSATLRQLHQSRASAGGQKTAARAVPATGLSPRYQLAYDYLMNQSHREDLSVHEIAASIGVSERALQLRFKSSFGLSPRDLIRQARSQAPARTQAQRHEAHSAA